MDKDIYDYIKHGIIIKGNPIDGYEVFTIPTQWFKMDSLHQLTPETFQDAIEKQIESERVTSEIFREVFKEVQNEIDNNILNVLRGGEPNPDIIPMNTIERLFYKFMDTPDPDSDPDTDIIWNKEQFVNMLLTDDEFYQRWGEGSCVELTYEERYKIWFSNNYETGMEYNLEIIPDWDNDYYDSTPKRKFK